MEEVRQEGEQAALEEEGEGCLPRLQPGEAGRTCTRRRLLPQSQNEEQRRWKRAARAR